MLNTKKDILMKKSTLKETKKPRNKAAMIMITDIKNDIVNILNWWGT